MNPEEKIIEILSHIPSEDGYKKLSVIKNIQLSFLTTSLGSGGSIKNDFQKCIGNIFELSVMNIRAEKLEDYPNGLIVISNHLGLNKLTKIRPADISARLPNKSILEIPRLENDDPFILLLAPVTEYLARQFDTINVYEVIYVFMRLEHSYDIILQSLNAVTIERNKPNQYGLLKKALENKTKEAKKHNKKPLIVIFPEGGTSGKNNCAGPYTLIDFKKGYKLLANDLNLPVLPVAVKFDENINFNVIAGHALPTNSSLIQDKNYLQSLLE